MQLCEFSKLKHLPFVGSGATSEPDEMITPADSEAEACGGNILVLGRIGSVPNPAREKLIERTGQQLWLCQPPLVTKKP